MTIYALSSGPGISGIAVIRVSGKKTAEVIKKLTGSKSVVKKFGVLPRAAPTLVGFGIISSSGESETPAPKTILVLLNNIQNVLNPSLNLDKKKILYFMFSEFFKFKINE